MLKASALYMVIVIALVISVFCSALIAAAYYYKSLYQQNFRQELLRTNCRSGINLLLTSPGKFTTPERLSLFGGDNDSLILHQYAWGVYDAGVSRSFIQRDTLSKTFLMANTIDSARWAALYIIDEDRSLSVSGKTQLKGDVFIPKAGIKEAYVNGQAYSGDKNIVSGHKKTSDKTLPALLQARIAGLTSCFKNPQTNDSTFIKDDSCKVSFLNSVKCYNFQKKTYLLSNCKLSGAIILYSDTTLTIDSTARLENTLIFARNIVVKSGFRGSCQIFALDSIHIQQHCLFDYPSCIGLLDLSDKPKFIPLITVDNYSVINGVVFSYQKTKSNLLPVISMGKYTTVRGQIYAQGLLNLKDSTTVYGSVFTQRFIYQSNYTRYENYLINTTIDNSRLSPYYLGSDLVPVTRKNRKVLAWLQ